MRLPRVRLSVRWMMIAVAAVGLFLGWMDAERVRGLASGFRRKAEAAARMEGRCREIEAMGPVTRAREAEAAFDNPYLNDPDWNRKMIDYFAAMKVKYNQAADHPRLPILPDPPPP